MKSRRDADAPSSSEGVVLPARTPAQGFHLGQLAAVRGALQALASATDSASIAAARAQLQQAIAECWERYLSATAATASERAALEKAGLPREIYLDPKEDAPVAVWPETNSALTDAWGLFSIPPADPNSKIPMRIAPLFQPIDAAALPKDTRVVTLRDPRIVATAALEHVLATQAGDAARQIVADDARGSWARIFQLSAWYTQSARMVVEKLPYDHLRDWADVPASAWTNTPLGEGALLIERHGRTVLALKALALQFASALFRRAMDQAERQHPRDLVAAADQLIQSCAQRHAVLAEQLMAMEQLILQQHGLTASAMDLQVLFANNTRDLPQLALIPRTARVEPTPLRSG
jgi:hypothetical protein